MARKARSPEVILAEHTKYRRQCQIRIKPSLQLTGIALLIACGLLWRQLVGWLGAAIIVGIPLIFTLLEIFSFMRHDRIIKVLSDEKNL